MAKKTGFTMERHHDTGRKLRQMHEDLIKIHVAVANSYPRTTGRSRKISRKLAQMENALSVVRSELEELMAKEFPDEWNTSVYYGGHGPENKK